MQTNPDLMSEKSDTVMKAIRSALIAKGDSLRQWSHRWGVKRGHKESAAYDIVRMTIRRRLERGLPPLGELGRTLTADLYAELGPRVIPSSAIADIKGTTDE